MDHKGEERAFGAHTPRFILAPLTGEEERGLDPQPARTHGKKASADGEETAAEASEAPTPRERAPAKDGGAGTVADAPDEKKKRKRAPRSRKTATAVESAAAAQAPAKEDAGAERGGETGAPVAAPPATDGTRGRVVRRRRTAAGPGTQAEAAEENGRRRHTSRKTADTGTDADAGGVPR